MNKEFQLLAIIMLLMALSASSQVKMGDNPATINPQAVLELESTSKAFLPPRMNTSQMNAITTPGAVVYNTDEGCLFTRNATEWVSACSMVARKPGVLLSRTNPFFSDIGSTKVTSAPANRSYTSPTVVLMDSALVLLNFATRITEFSNLAGNYFSESEGASAKLYGVLVEHRVNGGAYTSIFHDAHSFSTASSYVTGHYTLSGSKILQLSAGSHEFRFTFTAFAIDTAGFSYEMSNSSRSFLEVVKL